VGEVGRRMMWKRRVAPFGPARGRLWVVMVATKKRVGGRGAGGEVWARMLMARMEVRAWGVRVWSGVVLDVVTEAMVRWKANSLVGSGAGRSRGDLGVDDGVSVGYGW
jgi:hypothetical protein